MDLKAEKNCDSLSLFDTVMFSTGCKVGDGTEKLTF